VQLKGGHGLTGGNLVRRSVRSGSQALTSSLNSKNAILYGLLHFDDGAIHRRSLSTAGVYVRRSPRCTNNAAHFAELW
jgi:hypothetical protein